MTILKYHDILKIIKFKRGKISMEVAVCFGVRCAPRKRGLKLTRENYITVSNKSSFGKNRNYMRALQENDMETLRWYKGKYRDQEGLIYTDEWCRQQYEDAMKNYDLNMAFFKNLNKSEFNDEIERFLKNTPFIEIEDLNLYSCAGYYVMVLGEYCQVYIGTSQNIKERISQHWGGSKNRFDRLIFGGIEASKLSINSFRALDTTRIFVYKTDELYTQEDKYINCFSDKFVCNRLSGGIKKSEIDILLSVKNRQL